MLLRRLTTILAVVTLFGVGCAGQADDPCAAVTCAPGRVCVEGRCELDPTRADQGVWDLLPGRDLGEPLDLASDASDAGVDLGRDSAPPPDLGADAPTGRWVATDGVDCTKRCLQEGGLNVPSVPEEAYCMSGEVRPASGLAAGIPFPHGCTGGCVPMTGLVRSQSHDKFCYVPGQKKDADKTDITVGCYCR